GFEPLDVPAVIASPGAVGERGLECGQNVRIVGRPGRGHATILHLPPQRRALHNNCSIRSGGDRPLSESTGIYAYVVVFVALVAVAFVLPIPEEIAIVTAGCLFAHAATVDPTLPLDWAVHFFVRPQPDAVEI